MKHIEKLLAIRVLLVLGVYFMAFCGQNGPGVESSASFSFAVLGDRTTGHAPGVFEEIIGQVNRLNPDIVLTIGDAIEGYSDDKDLLRGEWNEFMGLRRLVWAPFFYTIGNHDISPGHEDAMRPPFLEFMGETRYTFTFRNAYFVMFDSSLWENYDDLPESEMAWLEDALKKKPDVDHILVFMHRPYWFEYIASGKPDKMHDIFMKYGVDAVFTGHYHYYCSAEYDGIMYTLIGSSGGKLFQGEIEEEGKFYHFLCGRVMGKAISLGIVKHGDPENAVLPWDLITVDDLKSEFGAGREGMNPDEETRISGRVGSSV